MAIAFVSEIGTNANQSSGTTLAITVGAGGVGAGNSIIVGIAMDANAGTVSCADTATNTYTADVDVSQGTGTGGIRCVTLAAHNVSALVSTNTITVTFPTTVAKAITAREYSGLATSDTLDDTAVGAGNTNDPDSAGATTTQDDALLIGHCAVESDATNGNITTVDADWNARTQASTNNGAKTSNATINSMDRIVAAAATYTYNDSTLNCLSEAGDWAVNLATYKAAGAGAAATYSGRGVGRGIGRGIFR